MNIHENEAPTQGQEAGRSAAAVRHWRRAGWECQSIGELRGSGYVDSVAVGAMYVTRKA